MDIIRDLQWNIIKAVLWVLDGFFNLINSIWKYSFFENEYVTKLFNGAVILACSWLAIKIVIEIVLNHIVRTNHESPLVVYRGAILAIVMMFLIPPLFSFGHDFSTRLNTAVLSVSHYRESAKVESKISTSIVLAMTDTASMSKEDKENFIKNWKKVKINDKKGDVLGFGGQYKYNINFFLLLAIVIIVVFLLIFVGVQMAKRIIELAIYKIIGPFCCTSLTNKNSNSFGTWIKNLMGLFLITTVQLVSLGLLIEMCASIMDGTNVLIGIFLLIGALLFVINTPTIISSLLGQQSGIMSAFGDLQAMLAIGQGISSVASFASSGLSSVTSVVGGGISKMGSSINNNFKGGSTPSGLDTSTSQNSTSRHNNYARDNLKNNVLKMDNHNPFMRPYSLNYNAMRNQYIGGDGINNNNIDRAWY